MKAVKGMTEEPNNCNQSPWDRKSKNIRKNCEQKYDLIIYIRETKRENWSWKSCVMLGNLGMEWSILRCILLKLLNYMGKKLHRHPYRINKYLMRRWIKSNLVNARTLNSFYIERNRANLLFNYKDTRLSKIWKNKRIKHLWFPLNKNRTWL